MGRAAQKQGIMGLRSVQLTCSRASPRPVEHENETSFYADVEPLCMHAQMLLKRRETSGKGHTGKSETRRNTTCFTWVNHREHERRAWARSAACGSYLDESSQSGRLNGADKIYTITHHKLWCVVSSMLISSSSPPSMSLISNFLHSPHSSPRGAVFHFSKTATRHRFLFICFSLSFSCHPCPCLACGWIFQRGRERPLEQNEPPLPALRPLWLHTLRCDITSQMPCRGNYTTHTSQEQPSAAQPDTHKTQR